MTRRDPLLVASDFRYRERQVLKARYKANHPTSKGNDRTVGMHITGDKQASKKYRAVIKKAAKESPIDVSTLKQRCLDITRRHV